MPAIAPNKKPPKKQPTTGRDDPAYYERAVIKPAERLAAIIKAPPNTKKGTSTSP